MKKIIVIDDDVEITNIIKYYLSNEGYFVEVFHDTPSVMDYLDNNKVDIMILDVMLPTESGLSLCMKIRYKYAFPIIMLTAMSTDNDKINGLTIGADDYLTKPFNALELVARVKAQIRRNAYIKDNNIISIGNITIDSDTRNVKVNDSSIYLTPYEFSILILLAKNEGKILSAEQIFEEVWKEKYFNTTNTVMVHIQKIRQKIKEVDDKNEIIQTVWGVGYKIEK